MEDSRNDLEKEPAQAPPARANDPQKPGEPLRPGSRGPSGTTGPAGGVDPRPGDAHGGEAAGDRPDDRGTGGDRSGL